MDRAKYENSLKVTAYFFAEAEGKKQEAGIPLAVPLS